MNPDTKKIALISVIVVCLGAAVAITVITWNRDVVAPGATGPVQMLCSNPDCGKAFLMDREDFDKSRQEARGGGLETPDMTMTPGPKPASVLTCRHCGQESAHVARKCKECANVFIEDAPFGDPYPDKCPSCGYSEREARSGRAN